MHISDGVLDPVVTGGSWVVAGAAASGSLFFIKEEKIPRTAVFAACFFVGSLIHIPVPPGSFSVHLVLNGLCGVMLGPAAFPAVFIGLFLQSILFGHGGISALGFNACSMGIPAVVSWGGFVLWCRIRKSREKIWLFTGGALAGGGAVVLSTLIAVSALMISGSRSETMAEYAYWLIIPHIPVAVLEGLVTGNLVLFLNRVEPSLIGCDVHTSFHGIFRRRKE